MLDMKTLKDIDDSISGSDFNEVKCLRDQAFQELIRLKNAESRFGLNAFERKDVAVNIEIITRTEARLLADCD